MWYRRQETGHIRQETVRQETGDRETGDRKSGDRRPWGRKQETVRQKTREVRQEMWDGRCETGNVRQETGDYCTLVHPFLYSWLMRTMYCTIVHWIIFIFCRIFHRRVNIYNCFAAAQLCCLYIHLFTVTCLVFVSTEVITSNVPLDYFESKGTVRT